MEKFIVEDVNRRTNILTTNRPDPALDRAPQLMQFDAIDTQSPTQWRNSTQDNPQNTNQPTVDQPTTNPPTTNPLTSDQLNGDPPRESTYESEAANVTDSAKAKRIFNAAKFDTRVLELGSRNQN